MPTPFSPAALALLQASFLAVVLPRVLSHGRVCFRYLKCRDRREDAIQEMIALTWIWHLRLAEKGKDATRFPTALATYAARAVKSGCRLVRQERAQDVLSPLAQQRYHFAVEKLPSYSILSGNPLEEALHDNTKSPPDESVCFKLDFTTWLANLTERDRSIVEDLMIGERTLDVADKYSVSPGRIPQQRREYCQSWRSFSGDDVSTSLSNPRGIA
jgi:DNA-directed RNA polymerase specialized sigma24 family protein